jgi:hypothetical protein
MNEYIISVEEARDLLDKLFSERLPVLAFFASPTGTQIRLNGFVDSITRDNGLVIAAASPPSQGPGFIRVLIFDRDFEFSYGDVRVLPEEMREEFAEKHGESVLAVRFLDSDELLALFFTA